MMTEENELRERKPNCIVLDELHRAGAESWGLAVQKLLNRYPDAKLLGLTATNIRYLDNQRNMAQELFDGHVASEMSLGEAIVRGILNTPKYVLSVFRYQQSLEKYELRARYARGKATRDAAEEILEKLRRTLDMADGLDVLFDRHMTDRNGRYLIFCANAEHMRNMMSNVPDWFHRVEAHPHVYSAYSDDPETSRAFADFKTDNSPHLKLLFCIDMLNEGIHVPNVSGVILLRPTVSLIVYKQQSGRALSATRETIPVIFDIVMNIENLSSIDAIAEEMEAVVAYYREWGRDSDIINERFEVIDEVHDCLALFDQLNNTLTASWDLMYDQAAKYHTVFGNLDVPSRYVTEEGYSLGSWLNTQRRVRSGAVRGILTPAQVALLDQLGMRWESASDSSWERYYSAARQYRESNGDLLPNALYVTEDGVDLGSWISRLRIARKTGIRSRYLTQERILALDELGMSWNVPETLFERYYAAAEDYAKKFGNLEVPQGYVTEDGLPLGQWLQRLRRVRAGKRKD